MVEIFRADLNNLVSEASRAGSAASQFHVHGAINVITLFFSEGAASDDGDVYNKDEDVVDPPAYFEEIEL